MRVLRKWPQALLMGAGALLMLVFRTRRGRFAPNDAMDGGSTSGEMSPAADLETRKLDLERYKAQLDYRKFVLASVFAAIAIAAIPPLFQLATALLEYVKSSSQLKVDQTNKEAERLAKEEEFRETYIKDFLANALNQDIELRIRFAEYFSFVSASTFRQGWVDYRRSLIEHRDEVRQKIDAMEAEWQRVVQDRGTGTAESDRIERGLAWLYKEAGYVERNRSVAANPRTLDSRASQPREQIAPGTQLHLLAVGIAIIATQFCG